MLVEKEDRTRVDDQNEERDSNLALRERGTNRRLDPDPRKWDRPIPERAEAGQEQRPPWTG